MFCSTACRKADFNDRAHEGRAVSVRRLKSGKLSVVVHLQGDTGICPGLRVRIGKCL